MTTVTRGVVPSFPEQHPQDLPISGGRGGGGGDGDEGSGSGGGGGGDVVSVAEVEGTTWMETGVIPIAAEAAAITIDSQDGCDL